MTTNFNTITVVNQPSSESVAKKVSDRMDRGFRIYSEG